MSDYTEQEIQDAVEKIVRSTVRHPTGILGERKIEVSFSDLQEAAAGVYILYFNAPFYTLLLGARRLAALLNSQASTATSIINAITATNRLVTPIQDISSIANARAALEELESAVVARSEGFKNIETVPAYRRYVENLTGFISDAGANVRSGGSIVDTPTGARAKIPALVRQLLEQQTELVRRARLLAGAMEDFKALNLPRIAAQGVISRARDVLTQRYEELEALDENQRLEQLREVLLDFLAQRPLVAKYGAGVGPSEFISTEGQAQAFSDASHLASPAELVADRSGPYYIAPEASTLRIALDGGASVDFPFQAGYVAELTGTVAEPFALDVDSNSFQLAYGDPDTTRPLTTITLTTGTRSSLQVAAEVTAQLSSAGVDLKCEPYYFPTKYKSLVRADYIGGPSFTQKLTVLGGSFEGFNLQLDDEVAFLDGPDAGSVCIITEIAPDFSYVYAVNGAPTSSVAELMVEIGGPNKALRIVPTSPSSSLGNRDAITLIRGTENDLTVALLGWFPGAEVRSRPVSALDLATSISSSTSLFSAGTSFKPEHYVGSGRTDPTNPVRVVLSKYIGDGIANAGTIADILMPGLVLGVVEVGDIAVIRASNTLSEVGYQGTILAVSSGLITVDFSGVLLGGPITLEIGPLLPQADFGSVLHITSGVNEGRYVVAQAGDSTGDMPFAFILESALPAYKDGADSLPIAVELGQDYVTFKSRSSSVISKVEVSEAPEAPAAINFFTFIPSSAGGTTPWLHFDVFPKGVSVGDLVLLYETQYNEVSRTFTITQMDQSAQLFKVKPEVEATFAMSFDFDVPDPFGRIRVAQTANYGDLKERLDAWLLQPEQQDSYFRELARLLNPVLTNANPTPAMVNDANNQLKKLLAVLTVAGAQTYGVSVHVPAVGASQSLEFALQSYSAPAQDAVDALIATFRQKGADRAIDLLTEGQFSVFFKLDVSTVSYSGNLLQSLRDLAREDLPVRKYNRADTRGEKLIGSSPEQTDFEYSADDADAPNTPDIPAGVDTLNPGANY